MGGKSYSLVAMFGKYIYGVMLKRLEMMDVNAYQISKFMSVL